MTLFWILFLLVLGYVLGIGTAFIFVHVKSGGAGRHGERRLEKKPPTS